MKKLNYSFASALSARVRFSRESDRSLARLGKASLAFALMMLAADPASAALKNWTGPNPGTASAPVSGVWDTNTFNWTTGNGAGDSAFLSATDGAVFGGPDGEYYIQCITNLTASNIVFNASGYVLTNDVLTSITLPANRSLTVANGKTATIGTNVIINGNGNPVFFNPNLATGTLVIENGGTFKQAANQPFQLDGGPGSTIRVKEGGTLSLTGNGSNIRIGLTANSSPEIIVDGGSFVVNPGGPTITIGSANNATGTVTMISGTIRNSGTGSIRIGENAGSHGVLNLNGGLLEVEKIIRGNGTDATFNFNGGTVRAINGNSGSAFMNGLTVANVRNNTSTIDNNGFAITIAQTLVHSTIPGDNAIDGGLAITGSGIVTLAGTNTYTGPTIITNGTLNISSPSAISSSSLVAVGAGGTLNLSNQLYFNATGNLTLSDGTIQLNVNDFPTNIVTGTFATEGSFNLINIPVIVGGGSIPQATPLIKYSTLAPGVVDANNNFISLNVTLPSPFTGFLSNNVAGKTIELVLTGGSLKPQIVRDPASTTRYVGGTAQFSVAALGADGYFWRSNGVFLIDGGNVSGSKTNQLVISNVSAAADFDVVLTNSSGSVTSSLAALTVLIPENYAGTNVALSPVSYYRFSETDNSQPAADIVGGKDGVYLPFASHTAGPLPSDGYVNFEGDNWAVQTAAGFDTDAYVAVSNSWNINTNTVTLVAWINPYGVQNEAAGIIFNRSAGNVSGLNFLPSADANGDRSLGYTWNNDVNTYTWDSGLVPPYFQWSLVALVITPTNATIYVGNTSGMASAVHTYPHPVQTFTGPIAIGADPLNATDRSFTGNIDEVAAFNRALSREEILSLLTAASGIEDFPPTITTQPAALTTTYEHQTVQISAQAFGTGDLFYQWQRGSGGVYTDVPAGLNGNGSTISGVNSSSLVISNVSQADAGDYILIVTNSVGQAMSDIATLTVNPVLGPPQTFTTTVVQAGGLNWDNSGTWTGYSESATLLAQEYFGSTFVIQTGGGLRTPDLGNPNSPTTSSFPGEVLRVEGAGTFDTSFATAGGIRIKGGNPATVYFKKLIMAGGQISSILNSGWPAIFTGELNVISNTVVWASDDTHPRSITVQSVLTGDGSIQYRGYISSSTFRTDTDASLNIANANNPYTGTWFVERGTIVGSAANALGTNTITVGAQGALQTTYDINNPAADLILEGRLNLTQNDTFRRVTVNGTGLPAGTYTFAQLNSSYAANFPATWTGVTGALTATNGSGTLTVLEGPSAPTNPGTVAIGRSGGSLQLSWTNANTLLLSATNLTGPWTTNLGATSPFTVTNDAPQKFFRLQSQ
ncbi:MAG TPA: LamG-like jellyroll fold domain-containing protein [Verrucomicrobiae bacterium]